MNREISINLNISEYRFPLTVKNEKEEEILRKAAKLLDAELKNWQRESNSKYQGLTKDKLVAGVALKVVAELLERNEIEGKDKIETDLNDIRILLEDSILNK